LDRSNPLIKLWDSVNDLYAWAYPKADVSNEDYVYRRVHPSQIKDGEVTSAAFDDPRMSVDIASLTTPEKSHARCKSAEYGLVRIAVGDLRQLSAPQEVKHWPEIANRAHGLVNGNKTPSTRRKIKKMAAWAIEPVQRVASDTPDQS
jgi:hypothetical protein